MHVRIVYSTNELAGCVFEEKADDQIEALNQVLETLSLSGKCLTKVDAITWWDKNESACK